MSDTATTERDRELYFGFLARNFPDLPKFHQLKKPMGEHFLKKANKLEDSNDEFADPFPW